MVDQCSNCFFGQAFALVDEQTVRVCQRHAPSPINQASGPTPVLFPPVADEDWCGEGADATTLASYNRARIGESALGISAPVLVQQGPGTLIAVSVIIAGSNMGGAFDCTATADAATANAVASIPNLVGSLELSFPCLTGIVVVPGDGQVVSVWYD